MSSRVLSGDPKYATTYRGKRDIEKDGVSEKRSEHNANVVVLEARHKSKLYPVVFRGIT